MLETLHTTLAFIVAIALLIAVHEYGHFIVARKLGIKVEKFSIGFGPALFSWRSRDGEVQYVIAAIPLGGYVKMLGETPAEQGSDAKQHLSEEDRKRAFDVQPPWKRAAVAAAGPVFNFFFAIIAYMLIGWLGQQVEPPLVGTIAPASIAEQAGVQEGDLILAINGKEVFSWMGVEEQLKNATGGQVEMLLSRDDREVSTSFALPQPDRDEFLINIADSVVGISPDVRVRAIAIEAGKAGDRAGLQQGDTILQANGREIRSTRNLIGIIQKSAEKELDLLVLRDDARLNLTVVPDGDASGAGRIGVVLSAYSANDPVLYRMGPIEGVQFGFVRTWEMTVFTLQMFGKMISGAISPDNLGGPIAIAQLAGKTAELGLISFVSFLALISVNLAVLNLMPVPVLDGGHLVYIGLEKIRGKPLSPEMMEKTQIIGITLIGMLMIFAFYNDLVRWFRG